MPPRSGGLKGFTNYFLSGGCSPQANIRDLLVTIEVTEDIVSSDAFDLQLNAYSPMGPTADSQLWQQYVMGFNPAYTGGSFTAPTPIIGCSVEYFAPAFNVIPQDKFSVQASAPTKLPAGYVFAIGMNFDAAGNVIAGVFRVVDNNGNLKSWTVDIPPPGQPRTVLTSILCFQLNIVGRSGGATASITSGAGTITYSASTLMTAENSQPKCSTAQRVFTGENSNCTYGQLPQCQGHTFIQAFKVTT